MIYSRNKAVRARQLFGDGFVVVWLIIWFVVARFMRKLINELARVGTDIQSSGNGVGHVPGLSSISHSLVNAGTSQVTAVHHVANGVALLIFLGPTLPVVIRRVVVRLVWYRLSSTLSKRGNAHSSSALLAQRALIHQPIEKLLTISADPVADVAAGNFGPYAELEKRTLRL